MKKGANRRISRPFFCYNRQCNIIYSTYDKDSFESGFSFFCYGKLPVSHIFYEKKIKHINDICHCYYTPLKGAIRFFINLGDLWGEANAKIAVMNRIQNLKCQCGGRSYKRITHWCMKCGK
jgi:hypothetical protein